MGCWMINAENTAAGIGELLGLTADETAELTQLSRALPSVDEAVAQRRDARWIELYLKHESAVARRRLGQGR